jgi:hypothetical protein
MMLLLLSPLTLTHNPPTTHSNVTGGPGRQPLLDNDDDDNERRALRASDKQTTRKQASAPTLLRARVCALWGQPTHRHDNFFS